MSNRVIALIPARGGSKRFPGKNIAPFNGRPLSSWTLDFACNSNIFDLIYLNTDIDEVISQAADDIKICPRPNELAHDNSTLLEVIQYTCTEEKLAEDDIVVLLPVTGPLRTTADIYNGLALFRESGANRTVVSVNENPYPAGMLWYKDESEHLEPVFPELYKTTLQKQKHKETYQFNDLFVIDSVAGFMDPDRNLFGLETLATVIPQERSMPIDYQYQFVLAEALHRLQLQ